MTVTVAALTPFVLACAKMDGGTETIAPPKDAGAIVDIGVMAFLSEARALHHEANLREAERDFGGAISVMRRLVAAPRPHPGQPVPEVDEVLADAWARIAELELLRHDADTPATPIAERMQHLEQAANAVKEGLAHAPEPTYFRGHLLEVEGIVEEARGAEYADAGNKDEARKARARAIELLEDAVRVQEQVIGKALDGGGR